jgi:hypothetical protein
MDCVKLDWVSVWLQLATWRENPKIMIKEVNIKCLLVRVIPGIVGRYFVLFVGATILKGTI